MIDFYGHYRVIKFYSNNNFYSFVILPVPQNVIIIIIFNIDLIITEYRLLMIWKQ